MLALAGCGRSETYRYKLTLSLDTPDGVKTGFNVVELQYFDVIFPARARCTTREAKPSILTSAQANGR